jgi:hypothetical protein
MDTTTLPTNDLKKYGIIDADNSFSKKISAEDLIGFMQGKLLVADNNRDRISFRLTENNSLEVKIYQMDKSLDTIKQQAIEKVQFVTVQKINPENPQLKLNRKAFVFDSNRNEISEYDILQNAPQLTKAILEQKNPAETNRYKDELLKMREYLQEKIDRYPEIAKEITKNLNIISKEIDTVNSITVDTEQTSRQQQSTVRLDVNDEDLYQGANEEREEQELLEQQEKRRGFRR